MEAFDIIGAAAIRYRTLQIVMVIMLLYAATSSVCSEGGVTGLALTSSAQDRENVPVFERFPSTPLHTVASKMPAQATLLW